MRRARCRRDRLSRSYQARLGGATGLCRVAARPQDVDSGTCELEMELYVYGYLC